MLKSKILSEKAKVVITKLENYQGKLGLSQCKVAKMSRNGSNNPLCIQ